MSLGRAVGGLECMLGLWLPDAVAAVVAALSAAAAAAAAAAPTAAVPVAVASVAFWPPSRYIRVFDALPFLCTVPGSARCHCFLRRAICFCTAPASSRRGGGEGGWRGGGRWKQLKTEQVLRSVFASPAQTLRSLSAELGSSGTHLRDLLFMCSGLLQDRQEGCLQVALGAAVVPPPQWVVMQLMWDEAEHRICTSSETGTPATGVSILASHGHIAWRDAGGMREQVLALRPAALQSTSAACMWSALTTVLPRPAQALLAGEANVQHLACFNLGADHASANIRLMNFVEHCAARGGSRILVLRGFCKQHASGLVIGAVIKYLGLLSPSFCLCKCLRRDHFWERFKTGVAAAIAADVEWIREETQPGMAAGRG